MWLFGVARRVLANQRRGQVRRSGLTDRLRAELVTASRVTPASDSPVSRALDRLRPDDRDVLALQSDHRIYYEHVLWGRGSQNTILWSYPQAAKAGLDATVARSVRTFRPGDLTTPH